MKKNIKYILSMILVFVLLYVVRTTIYARMINSKEKSLTFQIDWFFREGNQFSENIPDALSEQYAEKQTPQIMCISCADSRVPAIWKFNQVFKICTAGNNILPVKGSMEYGRDVLNIPITIIVGHSNCGAIKAAMAGTKELPSNIKKEIDTLVADPEKTLNENIVNNVHRQVDIAMQGVSDDVERAYIGVVYDHSNDFGKGYDQWIIVNVNGQKDVEAIKKSSLLSGFEAVVL